MGAVTLPLQQMCSARRSLCFLVEISSYFREPRALCRPRHRVVFAQWRAQPGSPHPSQRSSLRPRVTVTRCPKNGDDDFGRPN